MSSTTIEEKLVAKLVFRLGKTLAEIPLPKGVEEMPSNDILNSLEKGLIPLCSQNLVHVLKYITAQTDSVAKQNSAVEEAMIRASLSTIYLLNLFVTCCQYKWDFIKDKFKNIQGSSEIGKIRLQEKQELIRPPPLDDRLARECYSKITPLVSRPQQFFQDKIQQAASKALFLLSVYNYDSIIGNLTQHMLPHCNPSDEDISSQLNLLQYLHYDAIQLAELLKKVDSATQTYKKDKVQYLLARVLRKVIWNWIDNYPIQFVALCQGSLKLQASPEQLFDVFATWSGGSSKKDRVFWPTQTMLLVLCPEIMRKVAKGDTVREQFIENLKKGIKGGKKAEVATVCYVDLCKAATFVSNSEKGNSARLIVASVEKELKERLFNFNQPFKNEEGNIDEDLMIDCLVSLFMLSPDKIANSLFVSFFESTNSLFKRVLVKTLIRIAHEGTNLPWNPSITDIYVPHAGNIRKLFQEFKGSADNYLLSRTITGRKGEKQLEKAKIELDILINLIELFSTDPALALFAVPGTDFTIEIRDLLSVIVESIGKYELLELHEASVKTLLTLHKPENIIFWDSKNPGNAFWIISSTVLRDFAGHLIKNNKWESYEVKKTIQVLHQILISRIQFLEANPNFHPSLSNSQLRIQSSSLLETALLIHLPSIELEIASLAASCIGIMCSEVDHIRAFIKESENAFFSNYDAYNQLANAANVTTGREVQQKAIRKILRQVEQPTNGNYTAWYKLYDRFKLFTQAIIRNIEMEAEEKERALKSTKKSKNTQQEDDISKDVRFADIPKTLLDHPNDVLQQWNHYINFLCALAAVSKGRKATSRQSNKDIQVTDEFLQTLIEYLVHDSINIQTVVKNAAGSSLSPAVYPAFFNLVSEQISQLKSGDSLQDNNVLFVDQVISVLKLIIDT